MKNKNQYNDSNYIEQENNGQKVRKDLPNRRSFLKRSLAATTGVVTASSGVTAAAKIIFPSPEKAAKPAIKITDLKCAIMGGSPVVRITTDAGIDGYGQAESYKPYLKPYVLFYKDYIIGEAPRERWWYEIIEGLPDPIVKDGLIKVWDRPGLGVKFNVNEAKRYLAEEDKDFFD